MRNNELERKIATQNAYNTNKTIKHLLGVRHHPTNQLSLSRIGSGGLMTLI